MSLFDADQLKIQTTHIAGEIIRSVRDLLLSSKMGVKNPIDLESFDLKVLPRVMEKIATFLSDAREESSLDARAKACLEALDFYKKSPQSFEVKIIDIVAWRPVIEAREKLIHKQKEERLNYYKSSQGWRSPQTERQSL